jgi:hypothetical protein
VRFREELHPLLSGLNRVSSQALFLYAVIFVAGLMAANGCTRFAGEVEMDVWTYGCMEYPAQLWTPIGPVTAAQR